MTYDERVRAYEAEGMTRSDAQGIVDLEDMRAAKRKSGAITTLDLQRYIGLEVPYNMGSLDILVKILDCKRSYGHTNFLITPLAGSRCMWVRSGLTLPTEGA